MPDIIPILTEARDHLGAALGQIIAEDDQIIAGHIRAAHALLTMVVYPVNQTTLATMAPLMARLTEMYPDDAQEYRAMAAGFNLQGHKHD